MMSAKMATSAFLKITVFWNKDYDIIIPVDDVTNQILSCDSNYIIDMFMRSNFGRFSISMREVITTSILWGFCQKTHFFEEWSCFKFNNLGLALGKNLKFYISVAKEIKLKVRKFLGLIYTFVKVTGKKTGRRGRFATPPSFNS